MNRFARSLLAFALAGFVLARGGSASAETVPESEIKRRMDPVPTRLQGVDVEEQLEAKVPPSLGFRSDEGKDVLLGDYFQGGLPTIVTLNYSDCPMLCSLQLNALVAGLRQVDLELGKDYRIVTISLDPDETPERAHGTKMRYLTQYGRAIADTSAWTFLTGSDGNIHAAARALGFSYAYNEKRDEYVHPASFVVTTPDGTIARYIYGLEYHPKTLRLSLVESGEGKIGSTVDKLILYCFHYDASEGRYAPVAMNIMRVSGGAGALALGALIVLLKRSELRKRRRAQEAGENGRQSESQLAERTAS